ncbi:MAG: leucyl/phenylalanyl-tRNA--protein transferase [Agarilytica sp.]
MSQLAWLNESLEFPDTSNALDDPDGLLAVGGDLSQARLLNAYRRGIFPWYSEGQPILWWSPSPRLVLIPTELHIGRSNRKLLNKQEFEIRINTAFDEVMHHCAAIPRDGQDGTWIMEEMIEAYVELNKAGYAHSVETWRDGKLVGGLYGLALGKAFFGESMFSLQSGASKVAFISLAKTLERWQYHLIDCQIHTDYLASFGAKEIPRKAFEAELDRAVNEEGIFDWAKKWPADMSVEET